MPRARFRRVGLLAGGGGRPLTAILTGDSSIEEGVDYEVTLEADGSPVTWSIIGGADQALFTLDGSTLSMGWKDFADPEDADTDNEYVVQVRATKGSTTVDKTITVTVTDASVGEV